MFVGSFRGGKRGGSRTAHLKAAAAEEGPAEADLPATTWRTSRPRSRQQAGHPVNRAPSSRQSPAQVEHSTDPGKQPAEDADEEQNEDDVEEIEDEGEEGEDEEVEEDEEGNMAAAGSMHAEESGELMFEAEVVDALAAVPSSRPKG